MAMDRTAIERIEELAAHGELDQASLGLSAPAVLAPGGNVIHSLERFQPAPAQMRATFSTHRIADFCRYIEDQVSDDADSICTVDAAAAKAVAVIDYGDHDAPRWGRHRAELNLQETEAFNALKKLVREQRKQRDITDWLEDWRDIIQPRRNGEDMDIVRAISAIRHVQMHSGSDAEHQESDFGASRSLSARVEAKSGAGELPGEFIVRTPVYHGTTAREIHVRMGLQTGAEKPLFALRIVGHESLIDCVAEEIELEITGRLQDFAHCYLGSVEIHQPS